MEIRITVLGAGSWGTTVASLAAQNTATTLWARRADAAEEIRDDHVNSRYLPDYRLPESLHATADLEEAAEEVDRIGERDRRERDHRDGDPRECGDQAEHDGQGGSESHGPLRREAKEKCRCPK